MEDDESPPRPWWIDALNPVENLRVLSDARQFGRRAAEQLADRVAPYTTDDEGDDGTGADPAFSALLRRVRTDAVRAADLWADLIDGAAAMVGAMAERMPGLNGGGGEEPDGDLDIGIVAPSGSGSAVLWVANSSSTPVGAVRAHCSPLRSHLGIELPAEAVSFDPPLLDPLPARSRCGVEVRATIPADAAPGTYVTVVLLSNLPGRYVPMRVDVVADEDGV